MVYFLAGLDYTDETNQLYPPDLYAWDDIVRANKARNKTWRNVKAAKLMMVDVTLLAKCDLFIGQFTSNVFRLAYELKTAQCDCAAPYVSLDSSWCFGFALRSNVNPVNNLSMIC